MTLFVISGPSGSGKTTLVKRIIEQRPIVEAVSTTTRPPRNGEMYGKDYNFLSKDQFIEKIKFGEMFEWAEYANNFYGTEKGSLYVAPNVVKIVEVNGAKSFRDLKIQGVYIFIKSPLKSLEDRLKLRKDDCIKEKLKSAEEWLKYIHLYD